MNVKKVKKKENIKKKRKKSRYFAMDGPIDINVGII